jgi:hypothetical protein
MCLRLRILKRPLMVFLRDERSYLIPQAEEWKQIEYLITLTAPYNGITQSIGRTSSPSIHRVYESYNMLFSHIEKEIRRLQPKRASWKVGLRDGLLASQSKLKKYYGDVEVNLDHVYAFSWLLHPHYRNTAFRSSDWKGRAPGNTGWRNYYMRQLRRKWERSYCDISDPQTGGTLSQQNDTADIVRSFLLENPVIETQRNHAGDDELVRYFDDGEWLLFHRKVSHTNFSNFISTIRLYRRNPCMERSS